MSPAESSRVSIVGATGAVGRETLDILQANGHAAANVRAFASERSAGSQLPFGDGELTVESFDPEAAANADVVFLAANADLARRYAAELAGSGALVVDHSSAFRLDPEVPLVVPEINGHLVNANTPLVANPNCSTILLLVALQGLRDFGITRTVVSTYQAVSGAGQPAIDELFAQSRAFLEGREGPQDVFGQRIAFNVFPHESPLDEASGMNAEERKLVAETRRIWSDPEASIFATCVRVPVVRCHSESVVLDFCTRVTVEDVRAALRKTPGVRLFDDRERGTFPTPATAERTDDVWVGRVRCEPTPSGTLCSLWLCGDQLRKGAALNSIQIACTAGRLTPFS